MFLIMLLKHLSQQHGRPWFQLCGRSVQCSHPTSTWKTREARKAWRQHDAASKSACSVQGTKYSEILKSYFLLRACIDLRVIHSSGKAPRLTPAQLIAEHFVYSSFTGIIFWCIWHKAAKLLPTLKNWKWSSHFYVGWWQSNKFEPSTQIHKKTPCICHNHTFLLSKQQIKCVQECLHSIPILVIFVPVTLFSLPL